MPPGGGPPSGACRQAERLRECRAAPEGLRRAGGAGERPAGPGNGLPSPHVVLAFVTQLIRVAGVPGDDIVIYDVCNGRTIGEPIFAQVQG